MSLTLFTLLIVCKNQVGGACTHDDYIEACTREEDSSITFIGEIEGENVTFSGNDG